MKLPARVWHSAFEGFLQDDFSAELGKIKSPTLIVWGKLDVFCSRSDQETLLAGIGGSRLEVYDRAGHAPHWEEPRRFVSDLEAFVADLVLEVPMSKAQPAKLLRHAPYFPVADVERSLSFYEQVLGFRCEYSGGTPIEFAICSRDGSAIMLRRVSRAELIVPIEKQGGTWEAFFWVSDAETLHAELKSKGADIVYGPLIQESYRMREFAVRDCDGHVLGFGEALGK